jgi:hypothetical protein
MSAYCQVKWNNKTKTFDNSSDSDAVICCMNSCAQSVPDCYKNYTHKEKCDDILTDCANNCLLTKSTTVNTLRNCTENTGCGRFPFLDKKCLQQSRQSILNCCKGYDLDNCESVFDSLSSFTSRMPPNLHTSRRPGNHVYIFWMVCVGLALIVIWKLKK